MADIIPDDAQKAIAESLKNYLDQIDDMTKDLQGNLLEDVRMFRKAVVGSIQELIEGRLSPEGAKRNIGRVWSAIKSDLLAVQQESVARRGDLIQQGVGALITLIASLGAPILRPVLGPIVAAALGGG